MKKIYKYGLLILALGFLGYHSVYFEKLSEVKAREDKEFDFHAYADSLYYEGMIKNDLAVSVPELLSALASDQEKAFEQYGNRLGIGQSAYFMVAATGRITEISNEEIRIINEEGNTLIINTKYIFGNALRDASGLVKLTDFKTNAEFNRVSEALNKLIRTKAIPSVKQQLQPGDRIRVTGAVKLSKKNTDYHIQLTITPSQIERL